MQLDTHQKQILKTALAAFERQTGLPLGVIKGVQGKQFLQINAAGEEVNLELVVCTNALWADAITLFGNRLEKLDRTVTVLHQITAEKTDALREHGIQFIDTAGNCFINHPPLFLLVKGNRAKLEMKPPTVNRVFKQTGLRVLYALLCNPGLENETYRTIAAKTDVALGMVNWVFKDLNELGFLQETGAGRARKVRLLNKEKLLERWITAYAEQLRPKLVLGRYRGAEGWWQNALLKPEQMLWGGEVAAEKLTEYLKPQTITVYVGKENPEAVIIPNRLTKDPHGDVEIVARFWQPETVAPYGDMVQPLLVYADLMATGNQRNLETARIIYDQHIVQLVGEN